jgi:hypothetical protein
MEHSDLGSLDGWTFAQKLLGVTTHYKLHREDGSITIRIQGELTGCSVFDQVRWETICARWAKQLGSNAIDGRLIAWHRAPHQLAMLREADMYKLWMPFMSQSRIVREVNKTELVFHSTISVPWIATRCVDR